MSTRTMIIVVTAAGAAYAAFQQNLAALYVSFAGGAIVGILHVIEVKLNKLLYSQGISVSQKEISED